MPNQITIKLIIIALLFESCIPLKNKSIIFDHNNLSLPKYFCGTSEKFTPNKIEIEKAENIICKKKSTSLTQFYDPNLSRYIRQYYGIKNSKNEKIIVVNFIHKKVFKDKNSDVRIYFNSEFAIGFGDVFEKYLCIILVNIEKNTVYFPCDQ